jgi:C-terminal processing protease CtpA/Prc
MGLGWVQACTSTTGTIGAVLARNEAGEVRVLDCPKDLAAARAGLLPGDRILLIDGVDPRSLSAAQLHELLAGEVGSKVRLTVERGLELLHLELTRTAARRALTPGDQTPR